MAVFDAAGSLAWSSGLSCAGVNEPVRSNGRRGPSREQVLACWLERAAWLDTDAIQATLHELGCGEGEIDIHTVDARMVRVTQQRIADGGLLLVFIDRTDDAQQARSLQDALDTAHAASLSQAELLCSLTQDLRTPLQAVLGFAQLMQRDEKEPLPLRHRRRVAEIVEGSEQLIQLMDALLDLVRIERGQVSIELGPANAVEVVEAVHATLAPIAARAGVALSIALHPQRLPLVIADRARLLQVVMHLGSNAINHNRPLGSASFALSLVRPDHVRISVTDTAIPATEPSRIARPFQRARRAGAGSERCGVGLAISERLAHLMHCRLGFGSTSQQGSEVWLDIPVHLPAA